MMLVVAIDIFLLLARVQSALRSAGDERRGCEIGSVPVRPLDDGFALCP